MQRMETPSCRTGCGEAAAFRRRGGGGGNYHSWRWSTHTNWPDLNLNLRGASSPEARAARWAPRSQRLAAAPGARPAEPRAAQAGAAANADHEWRSRHGSETNLRPGLGLPREPVTRIAEPCKYFKLAEDDQERLTNIALYWNLLY